MCGQVGPGFDVLHLVPHPRAALKSWWDLRKERQDVVAHYQVSLGVGCSGSVTHTMHVHMCQVQLLHCSMHAEPGVKHLRAHQACKAWGAGTSSTAAGMC